MKIYRIGNSSDVYLSEQFWIVANTVADAVNFYFTELSKLSDWYWVYFSMVVQEEDMAQNFPMRSADGTVIKKPLQEHVLNALRNGAKIPFLFARVERVAMFLVGWSGQAEHAVIAHGVDDAIVCYESQVGAEKTAQIWEEARGMSGNEFDNQFVMELHHDWYIQIEDGDVTQIKAVGDIIKEAVSNGEILPKFFGILHGANTQFLGTIYPVLTYIRG